MSNKSNYKSKQSGKQIQKTISRKNTNKNSSKKSEDKKKVRKGLTLSSKKGIFWAHEKPCEIGQCASFVHGHLTLPAVSSQMHP